MSRVLADHAHPPTPPTDTQVRHAPATALRAKLRASAHLDDHDFSRFQALIHRETGIFLPPEKRTLLVSRLSRRVHSRGFASFSDYLSLVEEDALERIRMLECIFTHSTHFFREPAHFEFVERCIPVWQARVARGTMTRRLSVWSAGCSTGEEPYSIAMTLLKHFPVGSGWEIDVLATDLSKKALEAAKLGVWPVRKQSEISAKYLKAFMLRGKNAQEGKMKARGRVRSVIRFQQVNLNDKLYPVGGPFDMIFCRNVLIYFDTPTKEAIVRRLFSYLHPSGYLFLGHAESLIGMAELARPVGPTIYAHASQQSTVTSRK